MIELRDYQQRTVDICRKHAADGYTRILVVAPTGSGKACTAAAIMHSALRNFGARCLLFVHRQEIINHVIRQLARFGVTEVGVMRADDERTDPSQPIQVASTATLVRRDLPDAEIVIIDECFPAGVLVDETPIEHVRVGDLVSSFDPKTGGRCIKRVVRTFCRIASSMVRLTVGGCTLICTPNHRLWTRNGWVEAKNALGCEVMLEGKTVLKGRDITLSSVWKTSGSSWSRRVIQRPQGSSLVFRRAQSETVPKLPIYMRRMREGEREVGTTSIRFDFLRTMQNRACRKAHEEDFAVSCMWDSSDASWSIWNSKSREGLGVVLERAQNDFETSSQWASASSQLRRVWSTHNQDSLWISETCVRDVSVAEKRKISKEQNPTVFHLRETSFCNRKISRGTSSLLFGRAQDRSCQACSCDIREENSGVQSQIRVGAHAFEQSNVQPRDSGQSSSYTPRYWSSPSVDRWQGTWVDGTSTVAVECAWLGVGGRASDGDIWLHNLRPAEVSIYRYRAREDTGCDRSGRRITWSTEDTGGRRTQRSVPAWARVDSVEVLEPGCDGSFGGVCPGGLVYNLEVDGTHTYFANGVAVSNCHRAPETTRTILRAFPNAQVFGFTATPVPAGGGSLGGELFQILVPSASYKELIAAGWIAEPTIWGIERPVDLSAVTTTAGDFDLRGLELAMDQPQVTGDIVETWKAKAGGRKTVCFACTIDHSWSIVERFWAAGIAAAHLDGETPEDERERLLAMLETGEIQVLSNVDCLSEGWDQPSVKCMISARPTLSLTKWMQQSGRILRPWKGVRPIIIDHARNMDRHFSPCLDRIWGLDGSARLVEKNPYRLCPRCFAFVLENPCELCKHFEPPAERPAVREQPKAVLVEKKQEDVRRADFIAFLQSASVKGFRPGYASAKYKEKYGDWPPRSWGEEAKRMFAQDQGWQLRQVKRENERAYWQGQKKADDAPIAPEDAFGGWLKPPA